MSTNINNSNVSILPDSNFQIDEEAFEGSTRKIDSRKGQIENILKEKNSTSVKTPEQDTTLSETKMKLPQPNAAVAGNIHDPKTHQRSQEGLESFHAQTKDSEAFLQNMNTKLVDLVTNGLKSGAFLNSATAAESLDNFLSFTVTSASQFEIEFGHLMSNYQKEQMKLKMDEIANLKERNKAKMEENIKQAEETAEKQKEANKAGGIAKFFSYLVSGLAIILGGVLAATGIGTAAGAAMIAGGVLGVTQQVLNEPAVKDALEKAGVNMEVLNGFLTGLQIATAVVALGAGVGPSIAKSVAQGASKLAAKAVKGVVHKALESISNNLNKVAQFGAQKGVEMASVSAQRVATAANVANGIASGAGQTVQGIAGLKSAEAQFSQAESQELSAQLQLLRGLMERIQEQLSSTTEEISEILQLLLNSMSKNATSSKEIARNIAKTPI